MLEFNSDHKKARFNKKLEFNQEHVKARLKEVEYKLKKGLIIVSGLGLVAAFTGCGINKNLEIETVTLENVLEDELFNDNDELVNTASAIDYYAHNKEVMEVLEKSGVVLVQDNQEKTGTYEEFKQASDNLTENLNSEKIYNFTDAELTEFEKEIAGDYYILKQYANEHQNEDYLNFYNNVLTTKLKDCLTENGVQPFELKDVRVDDEKVEFVVNVNGEEEVYQTNSDSNLYKNIKQIESGNYDNFIETINKIMNYDTYKNGAEIAIEQKDFNPFPFIGGMMCSQLISLGFRSKRR